MLNWDLRSRNGAPHRPEILSTGDDARVIVLDIPAGERLEDHEVHERAFVAVVAGDIVMHVDGKEVAAGSGHLFEFEPGERHEVSAVSDARLLLLLTPWPGAGHPGSMTLDEKASARERAAAKPPRQV